MNRILGSSYYDNLDRVDAAVETLSDAVRFLCKSVGFPKAPEKDDGCLSRLNVTMTICQTVDTLEVRTCC